MTVPPPARPPLVFDAGAFLAFFLGEPGADVVEALLMDADNSLFAHAVNICEVFYVLSRAQSEQDALNYIRGLIALGLTIREDMDEGFWQDAGRLKAVYARISLADCCCITLAQRIGGEVVTTDHGEMDALVPLGICPIRFIR